MFGRLLGRLGIDALQFRLLLRAAIRMDFRLARSGGARTAGGFGALLFMYGLFSIFVAAAVVMAKDPYLAGVIILAYSMLMVTLSVLIEFGQIVVNPDDYLILGHLPLGERTFLAVKLGHLGFFVLVSSLVMNTLPTLVMAFKFNPLCWPLFLLVALAANAFMILLVIWLYSMAMRLLPLEKAKDLLVYLQMLLNFGLIIGNQFLIRIVQGLNAQQLLGAWYTALLPPCWFAAIDLAVLGRFSRPVLWQILIPVVLALLLWRSVLGRFSLAYAATLQHQRETDRSIEKQPLAERLLGGLRQEPQQQALFGLVLRYMARDRMIRMGLFPLFGVMIANYFVFIFMMPAPQGQGFAAQFLPIFMMAWFMQMILVTAGITLSYSEDWQASWIYWLTPLSGAALVRALRQGLLAAIFAPVFLLSYGLLCLRLPPIDALLRFAPLCLASLILTSLANILTLRPPMSREKRAGGSSAMMFLMMILAPLGTGIIVLLEFLCLRRAAATAALFAGLGLLLWLAQRLEEKVAGSRILRRGYEG